VINIIRLLASGALAIFSLQGCTGSTAVVPEQCKEARRMLESLANDWYGTFKYTDKATAIVITNEWNDFSPEAKRHLTDMLAYNAACKNGGNPKEQQIEVRDFDTNRIIVEGPPNSLKEP
jgi:hypothetical protein